MRIVHVITRFIRGGADENTLLTCNGQAERGHDVFLVAGDHHPSMAAALDPRIRFHHSKRLVRAPNPFLDAAFIAELTALLRKWRPEIVHTHESKAGILGRFAARIASVPTIVHGVHILPFVGVPRPVSAIYLALEKIAARTTHAYVDVSAGMRDLCLDEGLGTRLNHFVVPSGMDIAEYRNADPMPLQELIGTRPVREDVVVGLMSGTLEPRKRVAETVEALAHRGRGGNWLLLIAGAGSQTAEITELIDRLGMSDQIVMLGHREDLSRIMARADICMHAARNEGLPRVVVQYVLAGKPVLATYLVGMDRVVQNGHNGTLVSPYDIGGLADAFIELADDAPQRSAFAAASRAADLSAWDRHAMVEAIEQVYLSRRVTPTRMSELINA